MSAGTSLFLKACKKCTTTVFKMIVCKMFGCARKLMGRVHLLRYIMGVVHVHLSMEHEHAEPCGSQSAQLKRHQGLTGFE